MDKPWKVIVAFVGIFVAGAVFGGFFAMGMGWQLLERHAQPATPTLSAPVVPPPAAPVASSNATTTPPAVFPKKGGGGNQGLPVPQALQAAQLIRKMADRLGLTPAQRERIMPLIQRASEDFRRQQANYFREDAFILQRLQLDIAKELTPDQRARLEQLQERQRDLIRRRQAELQALQKQGVTSSTSSTTSSGSPSPSSTASSSSTAAGTSSATATTSNGSTASASNATSATDSEKKE